MGVGSLDSQVNRGENVPDTKGQTRMVHIVKMRNFDAKRINQRVLPNQGPDMLACACGTLTQRTWTFICVSLMDVNV